MIAVKENGNLTLIQTSVSEFVNSLTYCEHMIPFFIQGIKQLPNHNTKEGSKAHRQEQEIEKKRSVVVQVSRAQLADMRYDIEFARENLFTKMLYPLNLVGKNISVLLSGRADKVLRSKETLIVQEDKFTEDVTKVERRMEPFENQKLQVLVYLNSMFKENNGESWFDIPHKQKAWIINIWNRNNGDSPCKTFNGLLTTDDSLYFHNRVQRFVELVLDMKERRHHNNPKKCAPCSFSAICQFKIENRADYR
jgi:CRISPR/Cas system-associated exonuclease Cas4 (RecB family)